MYEYSWHANLRTKFVRIPVGKFEHSANLNNLLFEEYFHAVSQGHKLSNELGDMILGREDTNPGSKTAGSVNILIILDGLDEARTRSQERRALLSKLMERPAVIITSRSHDTDMLHESNDLHLEALGLSRMSVDAYLDNEEIVRSDTATEIHRFIKSKPFVRDMVRVPIHLDILCYSWDELHGRNAPSKLINELNEGENVSPKTTALYQAVVCSLWRNDIPKLGKLDHGEPATVEVINAVKNSARLERLVGTESNFLEQLANQMMESNRLEFTDKDIAKAIQRTESNDTLLPLSLERNLLKLSLLRSYPSEGHRKYRFVHLTFQEFFAARYLVRHAAHDSASFETILRQHKYNRRYEVVWMFYTGLLSKIEELDIFFNLLDDEPRDLVGKQHIQLFMYCLSECQIQVRPSRWNEYQERLEAWLQLEDTSMSKRGIGSSNAFPENILRKQLRLIAESKGSMYILLRIIMERNSLSESFIEHIDQESASRGDNTVQRLFEYHGTWISPEFAHALKFSTLWMHEQGTKLPVATINVLMEKMKSNLQEKQFATLILMNQRHLPDTAIKEVIKWLEDPILSYDANAILGNQATLPKEEIENTMERLYPRTLESKESFDLWRRIYGQQNLHAEAIAKALDSLEKVASRNEEIPYYLRSFDTCKHPLQPDDVERFERFLEPPACLEIQKFAVELLSQQPSLPTNVLQKFVKFLDDTDPEISRKARIILQRQPDLPSDITDKLRDLFVNDKLKVVAFIQGRLQFPYGAYDWLMAQIPERANLERENSKRENALIKYNKAVESALGQSDLPDFLLNSLLELTGHGFDFIVVVDLLSQQNTLSDEVVNSLVKAIPSDYKLPYIWSSMRFKQNAFADLLITALEEATTEIKAENVAWLLRRAKLDEGSVGRLGSFVISEPSTESISELAAFKSKMNFTCLCHQVNLDRDTILDLHDYIRKMDEQWLWVRLWASRHIEQFCAILADSDSETIFHILYTFFEEPVENLAPAYINGKTLHFYTADGRLIEQTLQDEEAFRVKFREAQRKLRIPEWARIKLPKARESETKSPMHSGAATGR